MKRCLVILSICALFLMVSCMSQIPVKDGDPVDAGNGVLLDEALADIAAYYTENLPSNTAIALLKFESEERLLSDYIFEELWIRFEDSRSFVFVERQNLELIQKELEYQYSGMVSDESAKFIGQQFGPQILVYGKITRLGGSTGLSYMRRMWNGRLPAYGQQR